MNKLSERDLGWVAGLWEGEGCFYLKRGKFPEAHLQMTDKDVVERLHAVLGIGRFNGPYWPNKSCKKGQWRWITTRKGEVEEFMLLLRPLMGERRRTKIDECLAAIRAPVGRPRQRKCRNGHPLTEGHKNVYVSPGGHRHCITCYERRTGTRLSPAPAS